MVPWFRGRLALEGIWILSPQMVLRDYNHKRNIPTDYRTHKQLDLDRTILHSLKTTAKNLLKLCISAFPTKWSYMVVWAEFPPNRTETLPCNIWWILREHNIDMLIHRHTPCNLLTNHLPFKYVTSQKHFLFWEKSWQNGFLMQPVRKHLLDSKSCSISKPQFTQDIKTTHQCEIAK